MSEERKKEQRIYGTRHANEISIHATATSLLAEATDVKKWKKRYRSAYFERRQRDNELQAPKTVPVLIPGWD